MADTIGAGDCFAAAFDFGLAGWSARLALAAAALAVGRRGAQPVHLAGRHPVDVGLLDHRGQGLLGAPAGLQERGEGWAAAILGPSAIVVVSFVDLVEQTDDSQTPRWPNSHPARSAPTPLSAP